MINKRIILIMAIIAIALNSLFSKAELGFSLGLGNNFLEYDSGIYSSRKYNPSIGLSLSIPIQIEYNDWLSFRGELNYLQKNYQSETYQLLTKNTTYTTYTNSYLEFPIMAHLYVNSSKENLRYFFNLGGYFGYWIKKSANGSFYDLFSYYKDYNLSDILKPYNGPLEFNSGDRRFDVGALLGTGFEMKIDDSLKSLIELRYMYSLYGIYNDYQRNLYNKYNSTLEIQIALLYSL